MKNQFSRGYMSSLAVFLIMLSLSTAICMMEAVSNEKNACHEKAANAYSNALAMNVCEEAGYVFQEQAATHTLWDSMPFVFLKNKGTKLDYTGKVRLSEELMNGGKIQMIEIERIFQDEIRIAVSVQCRSARTIRQENYKVPFAVMGAIICSGIVRTNDASVIDAPFVFGNRIGRSSSFTNACMLVDENRFPKDYFDVLATDKLMYDCVFEADPTDNDILIIDPAKLPGNMIRCKGYEKVIVEGQSIQNILLVTDGTCVIRELQAKEASPYPTTAVVAQSVVMEGGGYSSQYDHPVFLLSARDEIDIRLTQGDFFGVMFCGENFADGSATVDIFNAARVRYALPSEAILDKMNLGLQMKRIGITDTTVL